MKPRRWMGTALLCAVLLLCAACSPAAETTPAPAPTPEPTQAPTVEPTPAPPPWEADPGQFVLENLDAAFSDGELDVHVFLNNGSGPMAAVLLDSESGQAVRGLFSACDWKAAQPPQEEARAFEDFSVELYNGAPYDMWFSTGSNVLRLSPADHTADELYFSADGAEALARDLTALCPDPAVQCALVTCGAGETEEDTAQRFMDGLFAVMRENGHITDHEVSGLDVLSLPDALAGTVTFDVRFHVQAACPERSLWTDGYYDGRYSLDGSGWTDTLQWRVCLIAVEEGAAYRLDWLS